MGRGKGFLEVMEGQLRLETLHGSRTRLPWYVMATRSFPHSECRIQNWGVCCWGGTHRQSGMIDQLGSSGRNRKPKYQWPKKSFSLPYLKTLRPLGVQARAGEALFHAVFRDAGSSHIVMLPAQGMFVILIVPDGPRLRPQDGRRDKEEPAGSLREGFWNLPSRQALLM